MLEALWSSTEALDAIFGIYAKSAAQRWVRELCSCSVALFPSTELSKDRDFTLKSEVTSKVK